MSEIEIIQPTRKTCMADLRPALDDALKANFPGGMLRRRWDGDTLHLSGPGAEGTVIYESGRLVGRATLKPPASMMRSTIEEKVGAAIAEAAG